MLTQQEKEFMKYWAANRLRRKKTVTQFLIGIPIGLAFVIPIVISFASGWYKRAAIEANSPDFNPGVLLVALLLIVGFTAIFYQRHQWDQFEQRYRELQIRENGASPDAMPTPASDSSPLPDASDSPIQNAPNPSDDTPPPLKPASDKDSA